MTSIRNVFAGAGYDASLDQKRLSLQISRIRSYMLQAGWKTLGEMKSDLEQRYAPAKFSEASLSAQLRNLRKPGLWYRVDKRRRAGTHGAGSGIWEYRVLPPAQMELATVKCERPPTSAIGGDVRHDVRDDDPLDEAGREKFLAELRRVASQASK